MNNDIDIDKDLLKSCYEIFYDVNQTHKFPMRYSWDTLTINSRDDTLIVIKISRRELHIKHIVYDNDVNKNSSNILTNLKYIVRQSEKNKLHKILGNDDNSRKETKKILEFKTNLDVASRILEFTENEDERMIRILDEKCNNFPDIMNILHKNNINYIIDNKY